MEWGRLFGIVFGLFLSVPCYLYLLIRMITVGRKVVTVKSRTKPPNCLQDGSYGVHRFVRVNGVQLHYVEAGGATDEGGGRRPLMVFCHGFPEFWFTWRHQLQHFSRAGYRVVALDIRGYGESEKPVGLDKFHIMELVNDIKALVEHLGEKKFTLVGHDWGGAISWTFAAFFPQMLDNLIICNCPHILAIRGAGVAQKLKSWYFIFFQVPWLPELFAMAEDMKALESMLADGGLEASSDDVEAYKYTYRNCRQWTSSINLYRASFTQKTVKFWAEPETRSKIRNIRVRTLQIFGTADKYLAVRAAQDSAKYVPDHRLELLPGVSHWVQQEQPERVNSIMEDFLKKSE